MKHIKGTLPIFRSGRTAKLGRRLSPVIVIGLTGGIATGKSTVAEIFRKLGCIIISADDIAHGLIKPKKACWTDIVKYFGKNIIRKDRTIDRKKLAKIIFSSKKKREILNKITHKRIIDEIKKKISCIKASYSNIYDTLGRKKIVIIEAPLLIESDALNLVDEVIVVTSDRRTQIERLLKKIGRPKGSPTKLRLVPETKIEAEKIINSQLPLSQKIKYADARSKSYIIDNNSTLSNTKKQVKLLYNKLKNKVNSQ